MIEKTPEFHNRINQQAWQALDNAKIERSRESCKKAVSVELASESVLDLINGRNADPNQLEKALGFLEEYAEILRSR